MKRPKRSKISLILFAAVTILIGTGISYLVDPDVKIRKRLPNLLVIEPKGDHCSFRILKLDRKKNLSWFWLSKCPKPEQIQLDIANRKIYLEQDGKTFSVNWRVHSNPKIVKDGTAPSPMTLQSVLDRQTCAARECEKPELPLTAPQLNWVKKNIQGLKPAEGGAERVGYVPLSQKDGWLHGLAFGDAWHATKPIYYCVGNAQSACERRVNMAFPEYQISVSPQSDYLLITEEATGHYAHLYRSGSPNPQTVFAADDIVMWLPVEFDLD